MTCEIPTLSFVEKKVIPHFVSGKNYKEISIEVNVSESRIEKIIAALKLKFGCNNNAQLSHFLTKNGMI